MKRISMFLVLLWVDDARAEELASMNLEKNRIAQFCFLSDGEVLVYGSNYSFTWLPFEKGKNIRRIDRLGFFSIPKQGSSFIARSRKNEQGFLIYDKKSLTVTTTA